LVRHLRLQFFAALLSFAARGRQQPYRTKYVLHQAQPFQPHWTAFSPKQSHFFRLERSQIILRLLELEWVIFDCF